MMTDDKIIAVVQAHKEGKRIESLHEHCWKECNFPNWDFYRVQFRIAPEPRKPREWTIVVANDGKIIGNYISMSRGYGDEEVRVREIIE